MRDLVFISHANPEENEFTKWLGLQLTKEGYKIWSDVTKLIAGESFWSDIEEAIRNHTAKFLFILSKSSNYKQGTLDELHLAKTVAKQHGFTDFIIPLRVDDLPFGEINVAIHRLNTVDFTGGWAQGLLRVLDKLQLDGIPKNPDQFSPATVSDWWHRYGEGIDLLKHKSEVYLSNWFPIVELPDEVYLHTFEQKALPVGMPPYPAYQLENRIVSFAGVEDLGIEPDKTTRVPLEKWLESNPQTRAENVRARRDMVTFLVRHAWTNLIWASEMPTHKMANKRRCTYFTSDMLHSKLQSFEISEEISGRRSLVGQYKGKVWHFGITAEVQWEPVPSFVIRPHVLFSDDGKAIWGSDTKLHRARRSACKNWWNPQWRDRILASMYWLAEKHGDGTSIKIPVSGKVDLHVSLEPISFVSPVGYSDEYVKLNPFADEEGLDYEAVQEDEFPEDDSA